MFGVLRVDLTAQFEIVGGAVTGKCSKIFVEVRLIIEAVLVCDLRPIHRLGHVDTTQDTFESMETG